MTKQERQNIRRQRVYAEMKANIGNYACACGAPGVRLIGMLAVCAVCAGPAKRRGLLVEYKKRAAWWQEKEAPSAAEQYWDRRLEETQLQVVVQDGPGELVVRAHGEYHLKVEEERV